MIFFRSSPVIIILILVLLSVIIRWNAFVNPIQGSHVWLSAHTVITNQIWQTEGIENYSYNPVYTFPNESDKHMRSLASGIQDKEGNYYYVSYPPFSFYFAYLFFTVLFLKPNIVGLYVLNIIIHGLTSLLLYILICKVYGKKPFHSTYPPALLAASLYLFSAQALWCHVYMYFADSLIQLLWTALILSSFLIFRRKQVNNYTTLIFFGLISFLTVYTEWLGLFACLTLLIYAVHRSIREPLYWKTTVIITITILTGLVLTIFQYAQIDGFESFVQASLSKYSDRNGYADNDFYYTRINILRLGSIYWRYSKANLILLGCFIFLYLISRKKKNHLNRDVYFLLLIITAPILLHHAAFLEFSSMHDFSSLKSSTLFCVLIPVIYNSIDFKADNKITSIDKKKVMLPLFSVLVLLNITLFYSIDTSGGLLQKASIISNTSKHEQSLFAITKGDQTNGTMVFMGRDRGFSTQIQLLTQRNILAVAERKDVLKHLLKVKKIEGKVYLFDFYGRMIGIETIKVDRQSVQELD